MADDTPTVALRHQEATLGVDLFRMKAPMLMLLFAAAAPVLAFAQAEPGQRLDQVTSKEFLQQLIQDDVYRFISSKLAESLLVHRVEPKLPSSETIGARVSGTVIVAFEITNEGKVRHAMAVSGPRLLQEPVLDAVRQWKFKPFLLVDAPITVATSIPLTVSIS